MSFRYGSQFIQVAALGTFVEWHGSLKDYEAQAEADPHAVTCDVMTYLITRRGLHWMSEDHINGDIYRVSNTVPHREYLRQPLCLLHFVKTCRYMGYVLAERWPRDQVPHFEEPKAWRLIASTYVGRKILRVRWRPWSDTWGIAIARRGVSCGPLDIWFERRTAS